MAAIGFVGALSMHRIKHSIDVDAVAAAPARQRCAVAVAFVTEWKIYVRNDKLVDTTRERERERIIVNTNVCVYLCWCRSLFCENICAEKNCLHFIWLLSFVKYTRRSCMDLKFFESYARTQLITENILSHWNDERIFGFSTATCPLEALKKEFWKWFRSHLKIS